MDSLRKGTADIGEAQQLTRKWIFHIIKNTIASQTVDDAALILKAHVSCQLGHAFSMTEEVKQISTA